MAEEVKQAAEEVETQQAASDTAEKKTERAARTRRKPMHRRKKVCRFCAKNAAPLDYKDTETLRQFISERGKILPRRVTGCCAKHQRAVTTAVKRARHIALLPYMTE